MPIVIGNVSKAKFYLKKTGTGVVTFGGVTATESVKEVIVPGKTTQTLVVNGTNAADFCTGYLSTVKK